MHHLSIDIETFSSAPIQKTGSWKYIESPDFEILLFAYSLDGAPVEVVDLANGESLPDWMIPALTDANYIKHAYNAHFEFGALQHTYGKMIPSQWRCTMFHGLYCGYTAGLDATGKALGLPEDKQKNSIGKTLIRYFCVPCKPSRANGNRTRNYPQHDPDKWALFKEYNRQDVVTEMEIEKRLGAFPVPAWVQKQWEVDLEINQRGVAVDLDLVHGALNIGAKVKQDFTTEAIGISGLSNPNSVKQLSEWLNKEIDDEEITDLRKATVSTLLTREGNSDEVQRMLEIRQELSKTSTKKYDAIETCVCDDGRVRGLLQFYGANRTGRWAGRLVQVQNLPRTYTKEIDIARKLVEQKNADALRLLYGSVSDTLSQLIRTAFVAPKGHVLIDADFSAIEARVISWLAGEQWRLDVFRSHGKIYEASASQMFGVPIEKIKKGNPEYALRAKGKVAELALGYQGSAGALINMGALNMGLTEEELPEIVNRWRDANPHIRDLWYDMERAALAVINGAPPQTVGRGAIRTFNPDTGKRLYDVCFRHGQYAGRTWAVSAEQAVNNARHNFDGDTTAGLNEDYYATPVRSEGPLMLSMEYDAVNERRVLSILLPSGRKLYYIDPRIGTNRFDKPSIIYKGVNQTTKKWQEIETYGGKLVENCVQAIARDCLAGALDRLEAAGLPVVFHVHDEVVIDVAPFADSAEMLHTVEKIMSEKVDWAPDLPLNADGWVGAFFTKD